MKRMGLVERALGWVAGTAVVGCARLAMRRGDMHEFDHCLALLIAGNSGPGTHTRGCLAMLVINRWQPERS